MLLSQVYRSAGALFLPPLRRGNCGKHAPTVKTVEDRRQLWRLLLRKGQAECFATLTRKAFRVCTLAPLSPPRKGVPLRLARSPRRRLAPASGNIIGMRAVASGGRFLASRPKKPHRGFFPRSFIATRRTAVRLWLRARSRGGVGVPPLPPARSVSLAFCSPLRLRARCALLFSLRSALRLPCSLGRLLRLVALGRVRSRLALAAALVRPLHFALPRPSGSPLPAA